MEYYQRAGDGTDQSTRNQSCARAQLHLRWERVHVVGHSMGGMAAMKLAAAQPSHIISLTVISSTGGGWEAIPSTWRAIRYAWMARCSPPSASFNIAVMIEADTPY